MKISVITVNYNNVTGLEKTIKSVVVQKNADFEYLIIDGGSTDGSKTLIETYQNKIKYWVSEKDRGIYEAMNKGVTAASGDYLLFLNSGDTLCDVQTLEKVQLLLQNGSDIVYGDLKLNDNGKISEAFSPDKIDLDHMMKDTLWHPVSFINAELFKKFGQYSTQYKICGDYDFFFKVLIIEKVSRQHIGVFVAEFELNGLSSDLNNHPRIREEKEKIQKFYLGEEQMRAYWEKINTKTKNKGFFKKWFR